MLLVGGEYHLLKVEGSGGVIWSGMISGKAAEITSTCWYFEVASSISTIFSANPSPLTILSNQRTAERMSLGMLPCWVPIISCPSCIKEISASFSSNSPRSLG